MRLTIIVVMLFGIALTLDRISNRLADIQQRLAVANCLTEMKLGQQCPELKR